jgi:ribosome-binding protein aMBF1 (putative translation factor)
MIKSSILGELSQNMLVDLFMNILDGDTKKKLVAFRIKAILEEKGWSQQDLADAMGSYKSYISKILSGEQNMTLEGITSVEEALNAPIIEILR